MEVLVQYFYKVVDGFQIAEVIVINIHANAEVETSVSPVHDFEIPKLGITRI
jgi:hypothetical protein